METSKIVRISSIRLNEFNVIKVNFKSGGVEDEHGGIFGGKKEGITDYSGNIENIKIGQKVDISAMKSTVKTFQGNDFTVLE